MKAVFEECTETEEDEAMIRAINSGAQGDLLSAERTEAFLIYLAGQK